MGTKPCTLRDNADMAVYFTSDTHFSHANIIRLCNRPFADVDEMDEAIMERWNATVTSADTVYHLGDVALGQLSQSLPKVGLLRGHKILVVGNHDRPFPALKGRNRRDEYEAVFDEIIGEHGTTVDLGDISFRVSHFPYAGDSHGADRYLEFRPRDEGLALICGHVHNKWRTEMRQFNVGVDVNDFRPVHEDAIVDWAKSLSS